MNLIKNKWFLALLLILAVAFVGFKLKDTLGPWFGGYSTTKQGLKYKFLRGEKIKTPPAEGSYVLMNYMVIAPNGDTLINNFKASDTLMEAVYPEKPTNPILEAISLTGEGSTISALIQTDSLKAKFPQNPHILKMPYGKYAKFIIKVNHIISPTEFEAYTNRKNLTRLEMEGKIIDNYAASRKDHQWKLDSFEHFRYYIDGDNKGEKINRGDKVEFHVETYVVAQNALIVHSKMENKKRAITVGNGELEMPAYDVILPYLRDGQTAEFVITSRLGFGADGRSGVGSYAPILVKITDLKKIK